MAHPNMFFAFLYIRDSGDSLLLDWSRIKAVWSTAEAAGAEATQQEKVTCPAPLFRGLQLLLLWLIWLTLLSTKPNFPHPGHHIALCFLPLLLWVVLARNIVFAEELESAHQLAEFMLPGVLHDPVRECSSEETGSIKMHYT